MYDTYVDMPMAITAENLAVKYEISRDECDEFALQSQMKWKKGNLLCLRIFHASLTGNGDHPPPFYVCVCVPKKLL